MLCSDNGKPANTAREELCESTGRTVLSAHRELEQCELTEVSLETLINHGTLAESSEGAYFNREE